MLTKEFVRKCNQLAKHFEELDRGDCEVELNKLQRIDPKLYEQVLTFLYIGMNIGVTEDLV